MPRASQVSNEGDWGYDADRWDPERFVASAKKTRGSMMPFGGGVSMVGTRCNKITKLTAFPFSPCFSFSHSRFDPLLGSSPLVLPLVPVTSAKVRRFSCSRISLTPFLDQAGTSRPPRS